MLRAKGKGASLRVSVGNLGKSIILPACDDWTVLEIPTTMKVTGMQDITVELIDGSCEVDWISFR